MDNSSFLGKGLAQLLGNPQKIQQKMEGLKRELGQLRVTGSAGGGLVRITMNGERRIVNVEIDSEALADSDMLQDFITSAGNDAVAKVEQAINEKMQSVLTEGVGDLFSL